MKINSLKFDKRVLGYLPFLFEKYEIFVVVCGIIIVFLFAGFLFYVKAYKTITTVPEVSLDLPKVDAVLFEKTIKELEQRKQMAPDLPIIDPFR